MQVRSLDLFNFGKRSSELDDSYAPTCPSMAAIPLQAIDRRERLRRLALETIDLSKDPYFMRNHLGQYECRLCLTLHNNEGNYLAHTQVSLHSLCIPLLPSVLHFPSHACSSNLCEHCSCNAMILEVLCRASGISRTWQSGQQGKQQRSQRSPSRSAEQQ